MRYCGRIKRQNSFLKEVLDGKIEGKRPRGRLMLLQKYNYEAIRRSQNVLFQLNYFKTPIGMTCIKEKP